MKYKKNDIVKVKSRVGNIIPDVHVKLIKKIIVKETKGRHLDWPGYIGWECIMIYKNEVEVLRKKFCIPYEFPKNVQTFIYEDDIIL
jgi:hypothetical protein